MQPFSFQEYISDTFGNSCESSVSLNLDVIKNSVTIIKVLEAVLEVCCLTHRKTLFENSFSAGPELISSGYSNVRMALELSIRYFQDLCVGSRIFSEIESYDQSITLTFPWIVHKDCKKTGGGYSSNTWRKYLSKPRARAAALRTELMKETAYVLGSSFHQNIELRSS